MAARATVRVRIREMKMVKASQLQVHPRSWRRHPDAQRSALRAAVDEIGFTTAPIVRPLGRGRYELIDGHLRAEEMGPP